jgi:predicted nucleic acid-binding protein
VIAIYLLNTSVNIDALNRKRGRETLASSAMTVMEIYAGLRPHESVTTQAFLDGLEHLTVKQGRTLSAPDVIGAGAALIHKLVLMTDNRKDFSMPQLAMYSMA